MSKKQARDERKATRSDAWLRMKVEMSANGAMFRRVLRARMALCALPRADAVLRRLAQRLPRRIKRSSPDRRNAMRRRCDRNELRCITLALEVR